MRKALRGLLIGVGLALLIAAGVGGGVFALARPTTAGGKVLTYEVKSEGLADGEMRALTDQLKQRIDPKGRNAVVVRPAGPNRVEILVPWFGKGDGEYLDDVRQMVRQTGLLEFRILANPEDDREAIAETERLIEQDRASLQEAAEQGLPPPATTGRFRVKAAGDDEELVGYLWVELGEEERESLRLSERAEPTGPDGEPIPRYLYDALAAARGKTYLQKLPSESGFLLFSRDRLKARLGDTGKRVDYFVLARESPADALAVTGDVKLSAFFTKDYEDRPAVMFEFVAGAKRFSEMTQRNRMTGFRRQMAIIVDGQVVSAPLLSDPLSGHGTISGNFDTRSAHRLASILNTGALPVELKPDPVLESPFSPTDEAAVQNSVNGRAARTGLIWASAAFAVVLCVWLVVSLQLGRRPRTAR